ncbi:MAG: FAD-binding protein [Phycisphaerae bacterium]|nr:FAD-binding protein [Phycisphaerae bacterium]
MMNYIVLVKQVPDVSQITDNAFDPETGNLMRGKLATVINELDAQALALANRMVTLENNPKSKVIALTMGPPMADEVLKYSLARCADKAVLLTDRALGGADTVATANPLAFAVRKIAADMDMKDDYIIISGMQSVDGDTAQVPAQLAEELNVPCIAYATNVQYKDGEFEFETAISGGKQIVKAKTLPAVITVSKYEELLFPTIAKTRWANDFETLTYTADDIKATQIGVKGSKTRVIRVFPPPKTQRKCQQVNSVQEFADLIKESCKKDDGVESATDAKKADYILPKLRTNKFDRGYEGTIKEIEEYEILARLLKENGVKSTSDVTDEIKAKLLKSKEIKLNPRTVDALISAFDAKDPAYQGQVWVMAEINHDGKSCTAATFELIGKARHLADSLNTQVGVMLAGANVKHFSDGLIHGGADEIYVIEDEILSEFDPWPYRKAVAEVVDKYKPQIILYAATHQGRVLAPMVSYRLSCGLTADCTSLDIRDSSRKGEVAVLMQTRPALGGNVMATICTKESTCQMATARPGVMQKMDPDTSRTGKIIECEVNVSQEDRSIEIVDTQIGGGAVNFDADVIISAGRGLTDKSSFDNVLDDMTASIAKLGVKTERGASRAAVEQGYIERLYQVGQTGTAVGPQVYIALAISGAIQHMIGVENSQTIFAVNNDPQASVFHQCDYYMVGNVEKIVPELTQLLGGK